MQLRIISITVWVKITVNNLLIINKLNLQVSYLVFTTNHCKSYSYLDQRDFGYGRSRYRSGNLSLVTSPRWNMSTISVTSPGGEHDNSCRYQDDNKSNKQLKPGNVTILSSKYRGFWG